MSTLLRRAPILFVLLLPSCTRSEAPVVTPPTASPVAFREVTGEAGLAAFRHDNGATENRWFPETMSGGGGFVDLDGDGHQDLVLVAGGPVWTGDGPGRGALAAYRNDGRGSFAPVDVGLDDLPGYGMGIWAADLDNDGDQDLVYTTLGPNAVLRNEGSRFVPVQEDLFAARADEWSTAALLFDADSDGWTDILIGNYVAWTPELDLYCTTDGATKGYCTPELYPGTPGVLYRNRGDGTFEEAGPETGFAAMTGKTLGLALMDHDGNGLPDVVVANDTDPDQLFLNRGEGRFEDVGVASGMAFDERGRARSGMGIDAGVTDTTGATTVFVGNFSDQMIGVYRALGPTSFLDRAAVSGIGPASLLTLAFGLRVADFDLDGHQDVVVANGHIEESVETVRDNVRFRQRPHLFLSDGAGRFRDVAGDLPVFDAYLGRALATADVDGDADPDVLLVENGGGVHLWLNDSPGHALRVLLDGRASNRTGIGARVELWQEGRRQVRVVSTGSSYLGTSDPAALFGLGASSSADSIRVFWPSGAVSVRQDVPSGQVTVTEGT